MGKHMDRVESYTAYLNREGKSPRGVYLYIMEHESEFMAEMVEAGEAREGENFKAFRDRQALEAKEAREAAHRQDVPATMEEMWNRIVDLEKQIERIPAQQGIPYYGQ